MERFFDRDIWKDLMKWKNTSKLTLEVHGARQVGKTTVLKKFCEEEFDSFIYVNMAGQSGKDFLTCIENWHSKYFGKHTNVAWMPQLMQMYDPAFEDLDDTVILIDEIQESPQVYNLTRNMIRDLKAKVIVTGSYLGKVLDKEFFIPAGDIQSVTIYSMSFSEFLGALGKRGLQEECYNKNSSNEELKQLYRVYLQIGGYPSVIREYIETGDTGECYDILEQIVNNFVSESLRYFTAIEDINVFTSVLGAIAGLVLREKQGREDLIIEISRLVEKAKIKIPQKVTLKVIAWLRQSGIIGYATKLINADPTSFVMSSRLYFQDTGVANYFARLSGFAIEARNGFLTENYVYTVLRNMFYPGGKTSRVVFGMEPMFSVCTSNGGKLDFVLCGESGKRIGIEVKAGKNKANTGSVMLEKGFIDQLFVLKGNTEFGETGNIITLPLYFADVIKFEFAV